MTKIADYSHCSLGEAAQQEMAEKFVVAVQSMDPETAMARMGALFLNSGIDAPFWKVASQFTALVGVKTWADKQEETK